MRERFRCLDLPVLTGAVARRAFSRSFAASAYCFKLSSAKPAIFQASGSFGCDTVSSLAAFAAAANCFCSSRRYACFVSAVPTVLTTGLTGCTSSNESFELVRRAVGDGWGSGRRRGSEAGFVVVVFCVVLPVRLGRVDCA